MYLYNFYTEQSQSLMDAILKSVFYNVGKLLRSQKIITSTSERSLLKNLGSWLGKITLGREKPVLQRELDLKELLFQVRKHPKSLRWYCPLLANAKFSLVGICALQSRFL